MSTVGKGSGVYDVPGLKSEVVCDIWLQVQQSFLLPLTLYKMTFLLPQTPLFYLHEDSVWEMTSHYKQRTKNHLERGKTYQYTIHM